MFPTFVSKILVVLLISPPSTTDPKISFYYNSLYMVLLAKLVSRVPNCERILRDTKVANNKVEQGGYGRRKI